MSQVSTNQVQETERKQRGPSFKKLERMDYLEILDNYHVYPAKNLRCNITGVEDSKSIKVKFLTEEEKAFGWRQNFSKNKRNSKFLQTNLHCLPEHLWSSMIEFRDGPLLVGYKVSDKNIHYFVHKADTDPVSIELFNQINMDKLEKNGGNFYEDEIEVIERCSSFLIEKGIESWLTIRARKLLEGRDAWIKSSVHFITQKDYDDFDLNKFVRR